MRSYQRFLMSGAAGLAFLWGTAQGFGFSLLGPYEPWMDTTNGFRQPGDIGGPMDLHAGYRWNVPVITYGFDPSFLACFGTNGVAAVQAAIAILNSLTNASTVNLTNYPLQTIGFNVVAESQDLEDLQSFSLGLLLEHLGLAQPSRYVFALRQWDPALYPFFVTQASWPAGTIPNYIIQRNFDPLTLAPTNYVNEVDYTATVIVFSTNPPNAFVQSFLVDPLNPRITAVADYVPFGLNAGSFNHGGLTRDDVGGLVYLLSAANTNVESLIPGVVGVGTNAGNYVNTAVRPGVGQITLIPQAQNMSSGAFLPMTNQFVDTYFTNGAAVQQTLARIVTQPDILFTAGDTWPSLFTRTGTSNWINNAALNGALGGAGPGVIVPPVTITFNPSLMLFAAINPTNLQSSGGWGTFNGSSNPPVAYPAGTTFPGSATARITLEWAGGSGRSTSRSFTQALPASPKGTVFVLQASPNLTNWMTVTDLVNNGIDFTYEYEITSNEIPRYFRLFPAP